MQLKIEKRPPLDWFYPGSLEGLQCDVNNPGWRVAEKFCLKRLFEQAFGGYMLLEM